MDQPGLRERYVSYLLRVWFTGEDDAGIWRASLENPFTGERIGFASPELLFQFLLETTSAARRFDKEKREPDLPG